MGTTDSLGNSAIDQKNPPKMYLTLYITKKQTSKNYPIFTTAKYFSFDDTDVSTMTEPSFKLSEPHKTHLKQVHRTEKFISSRQKSSWLPCPLEKRFSGSHHVL